jgi:RNA polymerase sigma-70 factor (ECF subfamily)
VYLSALLIFVLVNSSTAHINLQEFEQTFRSHYGELCGFANKYLDDLEVAEETVQSVFVKFWENRERISISGSLKSYLYSSVKNNCLNQIKHMKIRDDYKEHNKRELEQSAYDGVDDLEASELEAKIHQSISALPEKRKKIFILSRYEGLKYKEIAEKLNISVKTVEHQMGSAIKQLKTDLADYLIVLSLLFINLLG